ncbi:MAG: DNA-3-methyladenine glycosylase [Candidatus Hadarchaeota archaeon]
MEAVYKGDSAEVAKALLGRELVHTKDSVTVSGRIVETEAYYGVDDPASRAGEKRNKINERMWDAPGTSLVYMVHANWLFNVVTEKCGVPGAVLIRALEPVRGIKIMEKRRGRKSLVDLTSGPGKLTEALGISSDQHGVDLVKSEELFIRETSVPQKRKIGTSKRIGVTDDLERELRFYIEGNPHVSR